MADLIISINGDVKNYEDALEKAQEKTEALSGQLETMSKVAGVAFAALTAEIYSSVKAFGESQSASNRLIQAMQNQGIYSDELIESYKKQADALQKLTGIDDDVIIKAQAILQGLIGNQVITQELTQSILDLSVAKQMDLNSTAELIGKGISGHTTALQKLDIEIDAHLDKEERTAKIIEIVNTRFGDQAAAANQGLGGITGLKNAFGNLQEAIGEQFAPAIELVIRTLTAFFQEVKEHELVMQLAGSLILAGTAMAGLTLVVGLGGLAWLKYTAAIEAAGIATGAMEIAVKSLVGATGLGLLLLVLAEVYSNWGNNLNIMNSVFEAFADNVSAVGAGLGKVLSGVFSYDLTKIKAGLTEVKDAIAEGYDSIAETVLNKEEKIAKISQEQQEKKAALAAIANAQEVEKEARKNDVLITEQELFLAKINNASQELIKLKTDELETLKAIQDVKNADVIKELQAHLEEVQGVQDLANQLNTSKQQELFSVLLAGNTAYQAMDKANQALFVQQNQQQLINSLETKKTMEQTYALQKVNEDVARRAKFLSDEKQFGAAYAAINQEMHSTIVSQYQTAFGDLAEMVDSKNKALKEIGKAAAIANIVIKTAEAAMNVFAAFSTIPIVGPALGIAAAGVVIAYGAEKVDRVTAAADGGLITGGIPGMDSVRALLTPGELVVPKQNYEEVVSSVANSRSGSEGGEGGVAHLVISLKDDLMDFIEAKLVERQRFNISLQGTS